MRTVPTAERGRCAWCGGPLPRHAGLGRPRRYCGQPCRQRAYEQRVTAARAGLPADAVVVGRAELDHVQDRLFALRCALEDAAAAAAERAPAGELRRVLAQVREAAGALDRLWLTPRD